MLHVIRVLACIWQEFSTIPKAEVKNMNAFFEAISKQKYEGKKMVIANYDDEDDDDDKSDDKSDDDRHIKNRLQVPPSTSRRRVLHALSDGGVTCWVERCCGLLDYKWQDDGWRGAAGGSGRRVVVGGRGLQGLRRYASRPHRLSESRPCDRERPCRVSLTFSASELCPGDAAPPCSRIPARCRSGMVPPRWPSRIPVVHPRRHSTTSPPRIPAPPRCVVAARPKPRRPSCA
jgi:hypothetical protein